MNDIAIIQATINDVDSLQTLCQKTFTETYAQHNTPDNLQAHLHEAFSAERLTIELTNADSQLYFAITNYEKSGYIKVNFGNAQTEQQNGKSIEIERIYVLQKYQGNNIGKALLEKAVAIADKHEVDYIWLGVWEKNTKAQAFYKKQGFVIFGQHSFFVGDDKQNDWLMKLFIKHSATT